mgnify:CR=1 FL=1
MRALSKGCASVPTAPWRSVMTMPRELVLRPLEQKLELLYDRISTALKE